ncbi:hypothetical protein G6F57_022381 [Rhizopus arrhizus]|nr:hypothetical protein G6F57_022381 [Rhizopus arrhizus]
MQGIDFIGVVAGGTRTAGACWPERSAIDCLRHITRTHMIRVMWRAGAPHHSRPCHPRAWVPESHFPEGLTSVSKRIVVIGAGFAGMWSALAAARLLDQAARHDVKI